MFCPIWTPADSPGFVSFGAQAAFARKVKPPIARCILFSRDYSNAGYPVRTQDSRNSKECLAKNWRANCRRQETLARERAENSLSSTMLRAAATVAAVAALAKASATRASVITQTSTAAPYVPLRAAG
jgi:hypothetical protein